MIDYAKLLNLLSVNGVDFVVIGGVAAVLHGSSRLTQGLDVVYSRSPENLTNIVKAFADISPYPRGAPEGLPFNWSLETVKMGMNFTLQTKLGAIDLFGEIPGGGNFDELVKESFDAELFGSSCRILNLEALIRTKRAAGRPKDFESIAELEAILHSE